MPPVTRILPQKSRAQAAPAGAPEAGPGSALGENQLEPGVALGGIHRRSMRETRRRAGRKKNHGRLVSTDNALAPIPMLPYFTQPQLSLGPLTFHAFGVLVALAILVGARMTRWRARHVGLDEAAAGRLVTWIVVSGFVGAHLVDRLVYFPAETLSAPWTLLLPWHGLSSMGGFLGAIAGAFIFVRRAALKNAWRYVDAVAYAFPFAWFIGRIGCFFAFDHPGKPTTFFLGQRDADGLVRHNLGLEEALLAALLAAGMYLLGRRPRAPGVLVGVLAASYAVVRFSLDTLRAVDVRYAGWTPGQFGALALLVVGLGLLLRAMRLGRLDGAGAAPSAT